MSQAGARDRPRERLGRLGAAALGDGELLALVLGYGTRGAGALTLANLVLEAAGGVHGLAACTGNELQRVPGVGGARAAQVLAAVELGRRTLIRQPADRPQLLTPRDVAMFLLPEFGARPVEQFGVVLLDAKHRLVRTTVLTVGTLDRSVVHPREVFREAAAARAAGIVLFHNHPSGDPTPSPDDVAVTRAIVQAGKLLDVQCLDHLVIGRDRYVSLKERGLGFV